MITALKYTFYAYLSDWRDIVLFLTHFKMLFTHPFPSAVFAIFFADSCFPDFLSLSLSLSVSSQITVVSWPKVVFSSHLKVPGTGVQMIRK